jgi:hypothetical protein
MNTRKESAMRRFRWTLVLGLTFVVPLALVACNRGLEEKGVGDVTASLSGAHEGAGLVQKGLDAWNGGRSHDGAKWIQKGTVMIRGGLDGIQAGLGTIRVVAPWDACVGMMGDGFRELDVAFQDLQRGQRMLTDDSPFNDDRGLALVRLGLRETRDQLAQVDDGVRGFGATRLANAPARSSMPAQVASGGRAPPSPCSR